VLLQGKQIPLRIATEPQLGSATLVPLVKALAQRTPGSDIREL
jgi:hypothetical protein